MSRERFLTWPNRLTMLRIILIAPFVVCLLNLQHDQWGQFARRSALVVFALMSISDLLDGHLARKLNQETPLGRFLDPVADKLLVTSAMVLLGFAGAVPSWVVVAAIGKDLFVVVGFLLVFIVTGKILIKPGVFGKLCTASQMALVVAVLLAPDIVGQMSVKPAQMRGLLTFLHVVCTTLAALTCWQYFRSGMRFSHSLEEHSESPERVV